MAGTRRGRRSNRTHFDTRCEKTRAKTTQNTLRNSGGSMQAWGASHRKIKHLLFTLLTSCHFSVLKQGRIHGNPVADSWAGAVMWKPLRIQKCDGRTDLSTYLPTDTARCREVRTFFFFWILVKMSDREKSAFFFFRFLDSVSVTKKIVNFLVGETLYWNDSGLKNYSSPWEKAPPPLFWNGSPASSSFPRHSTYKSFCSLSVTFLPFCPPSHFPYGRRAIIDIETRTEIALISA